jgi:hypothetical protein
VNLALTVGTGWLPAAVVTRDEVRLDRTLATFLHQLAGFAKGDRDICFPSVGLLADRMGCCKGHVRRQIRKAVALGLIELVKATWNACHRVFRLLWRKAPEPLVTAPPAAGALGERHGTPVRRAPRNAHLGERPGKPKSLECCATKNAADGGGPPGEGPPPAATEGEPAEPESLETPEQRRAAWTAATARGRDMAAIGSMPVASAAAAKPTEPLHKATKTPEEIARDKADCDAALAEQATHKARQAAAKQAPPAVPDPAGEIAPNASLAAAVPALAAPAAAAPSSPPPAVPGTAPEPSNPAATPGGWVARLFNRRGE